jgi:hypothetical protein
MLKKRVLSLITAVGLAATTVVPILSVSASAAETENLTKTVYTNVAQFKKITTTGDQTTVGRLVDGVDKFGTGYQYSFGSSGATVTVDLGRRYNIKAIELLHVDGGNGTVYVANSEDGSDKESVGSLSWSKSFNAELDGTRPYRYVIVKGGGWATFRELRVYADQTVTEVSRNKSVTADKETVYNGYTFSASNAVNGTNNDNTDAWVAEGATDAAPCHYMAVDLEQPQHIGYIEMQGRNGADQSTYRQDIGLYGADTLTDENKQAYITNATITDTSIATRLAWIKEIGDYVDGAFPFPAYSASNAEGTTYKTTLNDSEDYRYIVYKKESTQWKLDAAVGSFKAYVVNPVITGASMSGGKATIEFSDEMDANTITASNITVTNKATNQTVTIANLALDGYTLTFDVPNGDYKVDFADTVKNTYGVAVAANTSCDLEAEDMYNGLPTYTRSYNVALNKPVTASGIVYGTTSDLVDDDRATFMYCSWEKTPGQWIQLDLQKRYKISSIKMTPRPDQASQLEASEVEIQASNDPTFADYAVLDTLTEGGKQIEKTAHVFTEFNGSGNEAYRYVRLYAKSQLGGISEIQVWADQTMTEVSRNKTVIAGNTLSEYKAPSSIVDGNSSANAGDAWFGSWGALDYFRIDLGTQYPVGAVEIESRVGADVNERRFFNVYGHNNDDIGSKTAEELAAFKNNTADTYYTSANGYTKLTGVGDINTDGRYYFPMPSISNTNVTDPFYKGAVRDDNTYRYITFKRTLAQTTAIGEMRVMVINPVVNSVKSNGNKVTVDFSDEIAASSVRADKITVKNDEGTELEISNLAVNGYEVSFDVAGAPDFGTCDIEIARTVRNTKSVTMAANYTGTVSFGEGINVSSVVFDKTELTANETVKATAVLQSALSENKTVELIIAVKDSSSGKLKLVNLDRQTLTAGVPLTLEASVTLPADVTGLEVEAFVWESETLEPLTDKVNL